MEMLHNLYYHIEVFLFVMAWLIVLANVWNIISVFRLQNGKAFSSKNDLIMLGISVSYIITMLTIGF